MKNLSKESVDLKRLDKDKYAGLYYGQSGEDTILWRLFKSKPKGFYVDVGAHHPRKFSNTYLLHRYRNWTGVNIDATQESIDAFVAERPNDINICSAVSKTRGQVQLRLTSGGARNTISDQRAQSVVDHGIEIREERSVSSEPLADLLARVLVANQRIDLMNVDVEGMDLEVLQSNDWDRFRPGVIVIEDLDFRSQNGRTPISDFMTGQGFALLSHLYDTSIYNDAKDRKTA